MGFSYKIIFTDFNMPIMDGIDSTKKIRKFLKKEFKQKREEQPTIIGVTGHVQDKFKKAGQKAGMDKILPKPLYLDVLKETLIQYSIIES